MHSAESHLERSLRLAADDPAQRAAFYRALLDADVYVVGEAEAGPRDKADAGACIAIQNWTRSDGSTIIPFFSSVAALQHAVDADCNYLQLSARALFEITKGAALVLNPKSLYGKEFLPEEVDAMLRDGAALVPHRIAEATQVFLGQPQRYPGKLVDALTTLLAGHGNVKAAYLVLMLAPSLDSRPHLLVGIDADGDTEGLMREAGNVAGRSAPAGEPVDLTLVEAGEDNLSDYFLDSVAPFYERRWGALLHRAPGVGHA
ncbi:enhanced serine sensitivity protein SseB C-terminal domain-containing protein [Janthinobacterium fluminis]|uniref:Enhanced serine sensitivity protein SseB C-terminal domain-containing protein n=1 Tax=Janthinobacterium fluminis TaxID=2987524 RepID=A0ABT5K149_9BURK|nr:enhanced serine sensitivity protein SseB C-terminal domain-containing protein [Janthinobacterium fluminis]MDC8758594.1 enhanced serine sensitivity protein SseB C-terminal domain-containing protein [Janthinobacterium fluminis]